RQFYPTAYATVKNQHDCCPNDYQTEEQYRYETESQALTILQVSIEEEALSICAPLLSKGIEHIAAGPRQDTGIVNSDHQSDHHLPPTQRFGIHEFFIGHRRRFAELVPDRIV